jgi:hypothetical protein
MRERNDSGMDNDWYVGKRKKGFYLWVSEQGDVAGPCGTIAEALSDDGRGYSGGQVEINTNISLEELFGIMDMNSFGALLYNTDTLTINDVEISMDSFKDVVVWYADIQKRSDAAG